MNYASAAGVQHQVALLTLAADTMPVGRQRGTIDLTGLDTAFKEIHEILLEPVAGLLVFRDCQAAQPGARGQFEGEEDERADFDIVTRLYLILENVSGDDLTFTEKLLTIRGVAAKPVPDGYVREAEAAVSTDTTIFTVEDESGAAVAADWQELS